MTLIAIGRFFRTVIIIARWLAPIKKTCKERWNAWSNLDMFIDTVTRRRRRDMRMF